MFSPYLEGLSLVPMHLSNWPIDDNRVVLHHVGIDGTGIDMNLENLGAKNRERSSAWGRMILLNGLVHGRLRHSALNVRYHHTP